MYYARLLRVFLVTLSVTTVAQATWLENERIPHGAIVKRQGTGVSANDDPTLSTPPSQTPTPTPTSPPNDGNDDNDDNQDSTTSTRTTESTTSKSTETKSTTSAADPTPTDNDDDAEEPITETFTQIITTTNADGQPTFVTSEGTVTRTPGLSQGSSGGASGMTKETRNIVIGVVVGVGGAIVLGALGFVAWRIWGRKKQAEEHDNLMSYGDKPEGGSSPGGTAGGPARNPFQSTLETYHAPTQVNASSNF